MRRLALIAALFVPLLAAAPAAAKEIQSVTACGTGDCVRSRTAGLLRGMTDVGLPADAPRRPAPFYRLTIEVGEGGKEVGRFKSWWVPSSGRVLGEDGTWMQAWPDVRRGLARLTRGLEALPAARLPGFPAAAKVFAPPPAAPVAAAGDDVSVGWILATVVTLALAGLLVRRRLQGTRRARAPQAS